MLSYLGEIFYVTEEYEDIVDAVMTKGSSLSQGQRLYFESADFAVKGNAILKRHENLSPDGVPARLRADSIMMRHRGLSNEQAQQYKDYMLRSGFTYSAAISEMDRKLRQGVPQALSWLESACYAMESCDVGPNDAMQPLNREEIPPSYGFHKIGDMYDQRDLSWEQKQPNLIQRLITTPKRCNLEQLRKLGKACYEAEKAEEPAAYQEIYTSMSNNQKSVFWDAYNQRKRELVGKIPLGETSRALIKRIYNSSKHDLQRLKANFVRLQKGQIKVRDPPQEQEWDVIWWHYGKRESAFL